MFKKATLTVLIAMVIFSTAAFAQDDEFTFKFGAKAGWIFLTEEPFDEAFDNNWMVGADATIWMDNGFGFGIDAKFSTKDQDNADIDAYDMDFELMTVPLNVNAYYRVVDANNEFTPYFGAGFSAVYADVTATRYDLGTAVEVTADDWALGFNVIAGVEYGQFFVEGQYIWAETEFEDLAFLKTDEDDLNVGGFNVAVGVRF